MYGGSLFPAYNRQKMAFPRVELPCRNIAHNVNTKPYMGAQIFIHAMLLFSFYCALPRIKKN